MPLIVEAIRIFLLFCLLHTINSQPNSRMIRGLGNYRSRPYQYQLSPEIGRSFDEALYGPHKPKYITKDNHAVEYKEEKPIYEPKETPQKSFYIPLKMYVRENFPLFVENNPGQIWNMHFPVVQPIELKIFLPQEKTDQKYIFYMVPILTQQDMNIYSQNSEHPSYKIVENRDLYPRNSEVDYHPGKSDIQLAPTGTNLSNVMEKQEEISRDTVPRESIHIVKAVSSETESQSEIVPVEVRLKTKGTVQQLKSKGTEHKQVNSIQDEKFNKNLKNKQQDLRNQKFSDENVFI